mmetsp:Transcript_17622/g.56141  ORF Transcript_17622/g.56141 Transcript_17622/m.56141 type:complete len:260 (+) Transcript_17622:564-1343(+)
MLDLAQLVLVRVEVLPAAPPRLHLMEDVLQVAYREEVLLVDGKRLGRQVAPGGVRFVPRAEHLPLQREQPQRQRLVHQPRPANGARVIGQVAEGALRLDGALLGAAPDSIDHELAVEQRLVERRATAARGEVHRRQLDELEPTVDGIGAPLAEDEEHVPHAVRLLGGVEAHPLQRHLLVRVHVPPLERDGLRAGEAVWLRVALPHELQEERAEVVELRLLLHAGQVGEEERVGGGGGHVRAPRPSFESVGFARAAECKK